MKYMASIITLLLLGLLSGCGNTATSKLYDTNGCAYVITWNTTDINSPGETGMPVATAVDQMVSDRYKYNATIQRFPLDDQSSCHPKKVAAPTSEITVK